MPGGLPFIPNPHSVMIPPIESVTYEKQISKPFPSGLSQRFCSRSFGHRRQSHIEHHTGRTRHRQNFTARFFSKSHE